jgi:hypothetical protein
MRRPYQPVWTEEDDLRLIEFIQAGWTCRRMGEHFGRDRNAVIGRIFRQNLRERAFADDRLAAEAEAQRRYDEQRLAVLREVERREKEKSYATLGTRCATPGCMNNRLRGYVHGLCSTHNAERLAAERGVYKSLREIT